MQFGCQQIKGLEPINGVHLPEHLATKKLKPDTSEQLFMARKQV